jgi:Lar family restriction alleviation protein
MSDLLPCPFCGCEAELAHVAGSTPRHRVRCRACTMISPMRTKASQAIAAWNRRTPASAVLPEARSADTHTSPNAREALERELEDALKAFHEAVNADGMRRPVLLRKLRNRLRDALLSPHGGTQDIASIVETYTDILSPETARKVARRIRALSGDGK